MLDPLLARGEVTIQMLREKEKEKVPSKKLK
jgi:hypothetical protein